MKYLVLVATVVALGWFGFTHYFATSQATADNMIAAASIAPPAKPTLPSSPRSPSPADIPPPVPLRSVRVAPAPASDSIAPAPDPNAPIEIDLAEALGPNNRYQDTAVGLSVQLPEGWTVRSAMRWGPNHTENTVLLSPDVPSSASPSMYYKPYKAEETATLSGTGAEALLREQAQKKEASRLGWAPDYKNVPDSFSFFDVNGSPALSYFATFTRDDQIMTEHFIRILGPKGYVMFFTQGKFDDVKAIIPQLKQAASTVKGP